VERVIIEGYFTGQANPDNTRRAAERAGATKRWLQTSGGLSRIAMDDRVGAAGENKRVAKILIEERAENEAARTGESPRILPDIPFSHNSSEPRDYNALWEARDEIRYDVQQKGPARLVIQGHAAQNETTPATTAENRATTVRHWFESRQSRQPIPNLQLSPRGGGSQANKSMVRLIIERERAQTSRGPDDQKQALLPAPPVSGDWFNASSPGTNRHRDARRRRQEETWKLSKEDGGGESVGAREGEDSAPSGQRLRQ